MATPPTFTAGSVLTAAQMNKAGLWIVPPTSVAGTGVSISGNKVTFTSATSVSLNGVFSSGSFDNYRVIFRIYGTGSTFATFRLRANGTDESGSNYYRTGFYTVYSGVTVNAYNGGPLTSSLAGQYGSALSDSGTGFVEFHNPASASYKTVFYQDCLDAATATRYTTNGVHGVAAAYDGFTIIPNAGNITGTIWVYGFNQGA